MTVRPWILGLLSASLLLGFNSNSMAYINLDPYYGSNLADILDGQDLFAFSLMSKPLYEVQEKSSSEKIKDELYKVLSKYHVVVGGGRPDEIVMNCTGKDDCYRHLYLSYKEARKNLFGSIHLVDDYGEYSIKDVYCGKDYKKSDFPSGRGPGPWEIPDSNIMNAEHTWPQSQFSKNQPIAAQKSDLHSLFPSGSRINSIRGNHRFAYVDESITDTCNGALVGYSSGGSGIYFEPPDEHKGNAARAVFYFSVRYKMHISPLEEETLREWSELDPVDVAEELRHEEVYSLQNVRNPFIDHPEMIDEIDDF